MNDRKGPDFASVIFTTITRIRSNKAARSIMIGMLGVNIINGIDGEELVNVDHEVVICGVK